MTDRSLKIVHEIFAFALQQFVHFIQIKVDSFWIVRMRTSLRHITLGNNCKKCTFTLSIGLRRTNSVQRSRSWI